MMKHEFLVLHFGHQCPWTMWVLEQAKRAAAMVGGTMDAADVTRNHELAIRHRLYFPFMTVVDNSYRLPSPMSADDLARLARAGFHPGQTDLHKPSRATRPERIEPLTRDNIKDTCVLCVPDGQTQGCLAKKAWAVSMAALSGRRVLGFMGYDRQGPVGVVEFLPASYIPYPLPSKDHDHAFITCIYSRGNGIDCRGAMLDHLLAHLRKDGFRQIHVVAGRRSPYPNGPAYLFHSHRFEESEKLDDVLLREGWEELVYLVRDL